MRSRSVFRTTSALILVGLALLAGGCGGDDARAQDERADCFVRARAQADYAVVAEAYRAGRLWTPTRIEQQIRRYETPGYVAVPFFAADGSLLPLESMTVDQKLTFWRWVSADARPELRAELVEAEERATEEAREPCAEDAENAFTEHLRTD
jgi:hypothetical protein